MSTSAADEETVVSATEAERLTLRRVVEAIEDESPPAAKLIGPRGEEIVLSPSLVRLIQQAARALTRGDDVSIVPIHKQLRTQEAADLLNVSRQYLVRILEQGEIPFAKTGTHRRIGYKELMAYKRRRDERRKNGLAELTRLGQEIAQHD